MFFKKVFLKISPNSQENTCAGISFSVKFQACRGFYFSKVAGWKSATLLKMRLRLRAACKFTEKQASTQVFSCKFLRNFHEKLFCRTPPGHCFLMLHLISGIINKRKNKRRSGYFRYHPVFFCIFDNFYCRDCKRAKFSTNWKGQTGILKFVTRAFSYSVPNQTMQNLWNTSLKTSTYDKLLRTLMIPMNDLISRSSVRYGILR